MTAEKTNVTDNAYAHLEAVNNELLRIRWSLLNVIERNTMNEYAELQGIHRSLRGVTDLLGMVVTSAATQYPELSRA